MKIKSIQTIMKKAPLSAFFLLSFALSWLLWIPLLYGHFRYGWTTWEGNSWTDVRTMLGLLGSLGPALAAILMTYSLDGKEGVRLLLKRLLLWKVNVVWWLLGLYVWWLVASTISILFQLAPLQTIALQSLFSLLNIPALVFFLQMPLLIGIVGEEVGWRGFALPRLLDKYDPIATSLLLALPWIFWHTPLMVFQGWRSDVPLLPFLLRYVLLVVPLSLVFTWFFQQTKGSLLLVVVFHRALNLTFNAYADVMGLTEEGARLLSQGLIVTLWVAAAVLAIYWELDRAKRGRTTAYRGIAPTDGSI